MDKGAAKRFVKNALWDEESIISPMLKCVLILYLFQAVVVNQERESKLKITINNC